MSDGVALRTEAAQGGVASTRVQTVRAVPSAVRAMTTAVDRLQLIIEQHCDGMIRLNVDPVMTVRRKIIFWSPHKRGDESMEGFADANVDLVFTTLLAFEGRVSEQMATDAFLAVDTKHECALSGAPRDGLARPAPGCWVSCGAWAKYHAVVLVGMIRAVTDKRTIPPHYRLGNLVRVAELIQQEAIGVRHVVAAPEPSVSAHPYTPCTCRRATGKAVSAASQVDSCASELYPSGSHNFFAFAGEDVADPGDPAVEPASGASRSSGSAASTGTAAAATTAGGDGRGRGRGGGRDRTNKARAARAHEQPEPVMPMPAGGSEAALAAAEGSPLTGTSGQPSEPAVEPQLAPLPAAADMPAMESPSHADPAAEEPPANEPAAEPAEPDAPLGPGGPAEGADADPEAGDVAAGDRAEAGNRRKVNLIQARNNWVKLFKAVPANLVEGETPTDLHRRANTAWTASPERVALINQYSESERKRRRF